MTNGIFSVLGCAVTQRAICLGYLSELPVRSFCLGEAQCTCEKCLRHQLKKNTRWKTIKAAII